ncbi:MAG TPA: TetR/AcrR family transcriptional regulator [Anaerolineales bacterium]|nr:TetR/AcrR family transcriptional regulator [Anaerolineales bacterium]
MPRVVKEVDYAARRNEILDVARHLVYTKGYEQMSIQDILDAMKISKGALYHYFDSKPALLEALIDRMGDEAEAALFPLLDDPTLPALEKLHRYFRSAVQWKAAQKDYMLAILRIWYSDKNAITRQKVFAKMLQRVGPSFSRVIQQGIREGTLCTSWPEQATEISFYLILGLGDKFGEIILGHEDGTIRLGGAERFAVLQKAVAAYSEALERVLGAPSGSMKLMDDDSIRVWID